ncbi:hypothetical protein Pme01_34030 [Planosporangium mesophilum]|uniref:Uncharacterized protein n=1 Tax=Planosporangium mesophilum TaxID=689768 RepID=A0A8J3TE32_9ACTN|nr:hypothetical protein Pme01_34030 [Planosporangium mesophilum]
MASKAAATAVRFWKYGTHASTFAAIVAPPLGTHRPVGTCRYDRVKVRLEFGAAADQCLSMGSAEVGVLRHADG